MLNECPREPNAGAVAISLSSRPPELHTPATDLETANCRSRLVLAARVAIVLAVLALTVALFLYRDLLTEYSGLGYSGIFFISLAGNASIVLPTPAPLAAFAGGSIFNPFVAGLIAALGAAFGELSSYLVGLSGMPLVENREAYQKVSGWMARYGYRAIFVLAVVPTPLFDIAGILAGAMRLSLPRYFLVTLAGKIIKFVTIALLGAGLFSLWG